MWIESFCLPDTAFMYFYMYRLASYSTPVCRMLGNRIYCTWSCSYFWQTLTFWVFRAFPCNDTASDRQTHGLPSKLPKASPWLNALRLHDCTLEVNLWDLCPCQLPPPRSSCIFRSVSCGVYKVLALHPPPFRYQFLGQSGLGSAVWDKDSQIKVA